MKRKKIKILSNEKKSRKIDRPKKSFTDHKHLTPVDNSIERMFYKYISRQGLNCGQFPGHMVNFGLGQNLRFADICSMNNFF